MADKILIIDDDENIVRLIKTVLENEGYDTISASDADTGIKKAVKEQPGLIILDMVLPAMNGLEACALLRKREKTKLIPIIMLSAVAITPEDKVKGLDTGADDYLIKPFHQGELLARVKALFRRVNLDDEPERTLRIDDIAVDLDKHEVTVNNKVVELTPKEFDLLFVLMKKQGKVLSRAFLTESVWGYEYYGTTRTVDMTVGHLRDKLGSHGKRIETIEKVGYKFV